MFSSGDDIDSEEADAIFRAPCLGSAGRCIELASSNLSLQRIVKEPQRWRNHQIRLIDGRSRSFVRTRALSSYDGQPPGRCECKPPAFRAAHSSFTRLLQRSLRSNRTRSDGGRRSAARGLDRHIHLHTHDRSQSFTPWIHAISRYEFLDCLRRTKSSLKNIPTESAQELTAIGDVAAVDKGLDLERLMSNISSKARQAIRYVKLDAPSVSEAAASSGISESAVRVAVHWGLKTLALRIRQERGA
jgi:hypothetical protein